MREVLSRFGPEAPAGPGGVAVRLDEGTDELADVVRALDAENLKIAEPRDPRPHARRRLPRQDRPPARGRRATTTGEHEDAVAA